MKPPVTLFLLPVERVLVQMTPANDDDNIFLFLTNLRFSQYCFSLLKPSKTCLIGSTCDYSSLPSNAYRLRNSLLLLFFIIFIISHSFQELFRDMSDDLDVSESVDINYYCIMNPNILQTVICDNNL